MNLLTDMLGSDADGRFANTDVIQRTLQTMRQHLDMEVAYVSRFADNQSVYREVDAPGLEAFIKAGDTHSLDDVYCKHILEGRLPELIPNTAEVPFAMQMPITAAVPIGAHISVPIRIGGGQPYGMFCCLSPRANATLNDRDLQMMKAFADVLAYQIEAEFEGSRAMDEKRERIEQVLADPTGLDMAFQPIWQFGQQRPIGFECLARFDAEPARTPDKWFNEAAEVGQGPALELAAIRVALDAGCRLPGAAYIAVNASPATVLEPDFMRVFDAYPSERIVLEITEHARVSEYAQLIEELQSVRASGIRLAIDDAGAGYASLQHIIQLQPDIIKLDMSLTRHIDTNPARRALAAALIYFARETNCQIVAEGIETTGELEALRQLGITKGQGYFLGRPGVWQSAADLSA